MLVPKTFFLLCCFLLGVDLSFHSWQSPGVYPGILLFKEIGFSGIGFLGLKSLNLNDVITQYSEAAFKAANIFENIFHKLLNLLIFAAQIDRKCI
jgi:hypothetical protein